MLNAAHCLPSNDDVRPVVGDGSPNFNDVSPLERNSILIKIVLLVLANLGL